MGYEHGFISPVNQSLCAKVKIPVVLSEADVEITVDNVICLPELAIKVDRIVSSVRDVEGEPVIFGARFDPVRHKQTGKLVKWKEKADFVRQVVVHGTLHKQIFYVNRENNVKHVGEDVPFSKTVDLEELEAIEDSDNIFVQVHNVRSKVDWNLIKSSRVHQTGYIRFRVKVVEERQLYVQLCQEADCVPGVNLLRDPGFEHWASKKTLVFWGTSNVFRTTTKRSGSFAAGLGAVPEDPASLFQSVTRSIVPGFTYELCFFARKESRPQPPSHGGGGHGGIPQGPGPGPGGWHDGGPPQGPGPQGPGHGGGYDGGPPQGPGYGGGHGGPPQGPGPGGGGMRDYGYGSSPEHGHGGGHKCDFTLTAEVIFFDRFGNQLSESSKVLQSRQIPDSSYQQFCLVTGGAPEDATNALVRFSFSPGDKNRCDVKIDDAFLQCLPRMRE